MTSAAKHEALTSAESSMQHCGKTHRTKALEQFDGKAKRCIDVVGIFPDKAAHASR